MSGRPKNDSPWMGWDGSVSVQDNRKRLRLEEQKINDTLLESNTRVHMRAWRARSGKGGSDMYVGSTNDALGN